MNVHWRCLPFYIFFFSCEPEIISCICFVWGTKRPSLLNLIIPSFIHCSNIWAKSIHFTGDFSADFGFLCAREEKYKVNVSITINVFELLSFSRDSSSGDSRNYCVVICRQSIWLPVRSRRGGETNRIQDQLVQQFQRDSIFNIRNTCSLCVRVHFFSSRIQHMIHSHVSHFWNIWLKLRDV